MMPLTKFWFEIIASNVANLQWFRRTIAKFINFLLILAKSSPRRIGAGSAAKHGWIVCRPLHNRHSYSELWVAQTQMVWAYHCNIYWFSLIWAIVWPNCHPAVQGWVVLATWLGWNFYPWVMDIPKVGQAYHNRQRFGRAVARYFNFTHFRYCFAKFLPHRAGPDSVANVVGVRFQSLGNKYS